jgi:hypothetical protein
MSFNVQKNWIIVLRVFYSIPYWLSMASSPSSDSTTSLASQDDSKHSLMQIRRDQIQKSFSPPSDEVGILPERSSIRYEGIHLLRIVALQS